MFSTKIIIVALLVTLAASIEGGLVAPAVAPLAYANAIPYNIPPYADSVNIVNRGLRVPVAATYAAAPYLHATPLAAGVFPAPHVAQVVAPHVASPHAVLPHAHAYAAPLGYAAPGYAPIGYSAPAYAHLAGHGLSAQYY